MYVVGYSQNYIQVSTGVAGGGEHGERSPETRKICKGWEIVRASASSEHREQHKIKILLIFLKMFIKIFSKTFKFFLKHFQNFQ